MPSLSLDFEVFCGRCGAGLCNNCTEGLTAHRKTPYISVEPCEKCLEKEGAEEYRRGYDDAKSEPNPEPEEAA